jgi:hypothetical protein
MSDIADDSDDRIFRGVDQRIEYHRAAPKVKPNGKCRFCKECVTGNLLYCNEDCRQDAENEEEAMKRAGRR